MPADRSYYSTRLGPLTITSTVPVTHTYDVYLDVNAGVDIVSNEVFWVFQSIDPATGAPPSDPLVGFLPPNVMGTEGQGFATYAVRPRSTAKTGDVIDALATIVFDQNDPLDTPPYLNTLDAGDPSSSMDLMPAEIVGTEAVLTWNLADEVGGSGVKDVDIYVSADSGPFELWQASVPLTATVFTGEPGHTYGFFTVASDNAGNREGLKAGAAATTRLYLTGEAARVEILAEPVLLEANGGSTSTITATVWDGLDAPMAGYTVNWGTTLGTLSTLSAATDANGRVTVTLTSGTTPGVATVTASAAAVLGPVVATTAVTMEQAIAGLAPANDSPTRLGMPTTLTATLGAGSNVTYVWSFGDGATGSGRVASHTYPAVGVYMAVVTATNSISSLSATTVVTVAEHVGLGDVNDDDLADSTDALIILSADVGLDTSQFCPLYCGDVNGDGVVDSTDALLVLSYDVGIPVPFPVRTGACPSSITPPPGCSP